MTRLVLLCAAVAAVPLAEPARAAGVYDVFSAGAVFGDSLSDPGNLFAATAGRPGGPIPTSPPYADGRFSNGPVWAERFTTAFTATGRLGVNTAFGGARATPNGDPVPSLPVQVGGFAASGAPAALGPRPLAAIWIGANDLFDALDAGGDAATVAAAGVAAAASVGNAAATLGGLGFDDFLIFNLPDLGATPRYALIEPARRGDASAGTAAFNAALSGEIDTLRGTGARVFEVDVAALFAALLDDPAAFGLSDATVPCLTPAGLCAPDSVAGRAFWDPVHPTAAVHAILADAAAARLAPVPLPASALMLAAALAALAARRGRAPKPRPNG